MNPRLLPLKRTGTHPWTHYDVLRRTYVRRLSWSDLLKVRET